MRRNTSAAKKTPLAETSLTPEQLFDLLSSKRRRNLAIIFARSENEHYDVSTLASELAKFESDENSQNRCYVALIQQHLPRLEKAGVIKYDEEEKTITLCEDVSALIHLCELVNVDPPVKADSDPDVLEVSSQ